MYRNTRIYRIVAPSLVATALLLCSYVAYGQDVPITGLGHVSSVQATDAFILQRQSTTRDNFIFWAELSASLSSVGSCAGSNFMTGTTSAGPLCSPIQPSYISNPTPFNFAFLVTDNTSIGQWATMGGSGDDLNCTVPSANTVACTVKSIRGFTVDSGTPLDRYIWQYRAGGINEWLPTSNALASFTFENQGTTTTVLHGNAAGPPSWGSINDTELVNAYSGVGSCPSNQVNIGLTRNTAPTCVALTGAYIPGATSSAVGGIELAGVLAGTYLSPTFNAGAVAGHGLAVSSGLLTVDRSVNLSSNDSSRLGANECVFATTGIICEGSSLDNFQALLTITNPTADRTYIFPDASGTVLLSGGAVNGWVYSSPVVSLSTPTDKVGLGTASPSAALSISANITAPITSALSGTTGFDLTSADAAQMRMMIRGLASTSSIDFARSEGTLASPTALASGSNIGQITGSGYTGSAWTTAASINMQAKAAATWTVSSTPTQWDWGVTPIGSTTITNSVMRLDNAGHLTFPTAVGAPTVACTGTGTSPAAPSIAGTDNAFTVTINTGTLPSNTGTCTVTFGKAYGAATPLVCMLVDGASAWGNSSMIKESTESASAPVFTFTNDVSGTLTVLAGSSSYKFTCK